MKEIKLEKPHLKPVVYTTSYFKRGAPNKIQQNLLLKALSVTSDPKELRKMIGVRTVAEVYRTLDKLAIRKEYHEALARNGVSLDFIVSGFKTIAESGEKDADRIKALMALQKSIGLDKYDVADDMSGGTWEDVLLKSLDTEKQHKELKDETIIDADYEVREPIIPERIKKAQEEETAALKDIYG